MFNKSLGKSGFYFASAVLAVAVSGPASAVPISWTDWTSATVGNSGQANGTVALSPSSLLVSYSGQVNSNTVLNNTYPSWTPTSTFSGGTIDNAPDYKDIIALTGGSGSTGAPLGGTITFSQTVVNPVMAIWSLGRPGSSAEFDFTGVTPTCEGGGPSAEYGGSAVACAGNVVSGAEGNGVIQFTGSFNSISWTNPVAEYWYGFTVGVAGVGVGPTSPVPEPGPIALLGLGLVGLAAARRRKAAK